jgi:very-short-patch-repair endonuclease
LRNDNPDCEEFFGYPPHEPFFVKNLENVQGDERDVIFISVGYARTVEGYLTMNFGPVTRDGGERRLNVIFTRARRRCEIFTALSSADIDVSRSRSAGLAALKDFLHYAETGVLERSEQSGREQDSVFETQVQDRLAALGYTIHCQIGCAGFFLDLAVVDPNAPGRYLLGIECDGAQYHSARSARDRDRLRQAVLENLGWRIYRVWSTDWFRNPDKELRKLVEVIESAIGSAGAPVPTAVERPAEPTLNGNLDHEAAKSSGPAAEMPRLDGGPPRSEAYQLAEVSIGLRGRDLHELPAAELAGYLTEVVKTESPVHWREATRRLLDAAAIQRLGRRIESAVTAGVQHGVHRGMFQRRGDFLWDPGMTQPPIRDRRDLPAASRKLEWIAPEELQQAILTAVDESFGMPIEEIPGAVCRTLGFGRVTEDIKVALVALSEQIVSEGRLSAQGQMLLIPKGGPSGSPPQSA